MGYHRAGFDVIGVDLYPQKNYPFTFVQADALCWLQRFLTYEQQQFGFVAAIHASPPCQRYSAMSACRPGLASIYPDLIEPTRELLQETGLPYIIENVEGSPLKDPIMLCGHMFGLKLYRHRLFESNISLQAPQDPPHLLPASKAGHWTPGTIMSVSGHVAPISHARMIMEIDWTTREELVEAIPPAYTQYVGEQLMKHLLEG